MFCMKGDIIFKGRPPPQLELLDSPIKRQVRVFRSDHDNKLLLNTVGVTRKC